MHNLIEIIGALIIKGLDDDLEDCDMFKTKNGTHIKANGRYIPDNHGNYIIKPYESRLVEHAIRIYNEAYRIYNEQCISDN